MIVIDRDLVSELLSMEACIGLMEEALKDLSAGQAEQQLRSVVPVRDGGLMGLMPAYLVRENIVGAKLISVFPHNHSAGLPSHQGVIALFDAGNGEMKAVVDARQVTAIRTAAVSAAATKLLAKADSRSLALIGTGEQARSHLEAILHVRPIERVSFWSRNSEHARTFQSEMSAKYGKRLTVTASETAEQAVQSADIICTITSSTTPVLQSEWIADGAHINAVGACRPNDRELATGIVQRSSLYVDRRESAENEAGDYLIPLNEGAFGSNHIVGELGEALLGRIPGRISEQQLTLFKSLGLAVEDLAAAAYVYSQANQQGKGVTIAI
ncbi:ornithine cyclodeaminase family protein [Paenibacillus pasadenensis]|uniref:ornithine cyclodeaminase family protein n=1 Tax=Paenibacillus pasadenensis TaxID=217090 RepID=UPI00203C89C3|nr:ornithine cyclodeaminase family protein [Paenibacillus pasadenensis]MCM3747214.1 ornithine cyclodeaminase family protein [Paenibacillus pasadenensis]